MKETARTVLKQIAFPTALSTGFALVAYCVCGASLGLLLCGLFAAGIITALCDKPSLSASFRALQCAAITHGVAIVLLIGVLASNLTFLQWLQSYFVLISATAALFALLLAGISSRLIAVLWIVWFASPVLLAHAMLAQQGQRVADILTRFHPLFAFNRVLLDQGLWTGGDIAYRFLTPLGQDVPYSLPETVWPCVVGHTAIMAGGLLVWWFRSRGRQTATVPC